MSARYQTIAALLEDPVNRAIVHRELIRRGKVKFLPPPIKTKSGSRVFVTFRAYLSRHNQQILDSDEPDTLFEVFTDGVGWYVQCNEEGVELGPFDSPMAAIKATEEFAVSVGYSVLDPSPWDMSDLGEFPL